jgi:hypothetical protein
MKLKHDNTKRLKTKKTEMKNKKCKTKNNEKSKAVSLHANKSHATSCRQVVLHSLNMHVA